jgi:surface carbohydrate biosynthesis protein
MKKKVCIVVDHISRDLAGYIYLVSKFDKKKYDFYLVPFYNFREIYFIMPDMVILNHSRWIYKNFIKILNNLNISIFILDTEGGMITKDLIKEYYLFSEIKKNINYVDGYLIWSQKIKKEILLFDKKLKKYNKKLIVTGNPRFNYLLSQKKKN